MKKTAGRQKIEMAKIEDETSLQVSFSKRKGGLFKKAGELSTLCGVELAVLVNSPGKKIFSFGCPSAEHIVDRYLGEVDTAEETPGVSQFMEARRNATVRELADQINEAKKQIVAEKKQGEDLDKKKKERQEQNWQESPVEELDVAQLQELRAAMKELQKKVEMQFYAQVEESQLAMENTNPRQFFVGSSSNQGGNNPNYETLMNNDMTLFDPNRIGEGSYNVVPPNMMPPVPEYGFNPADIPMMVPPQPGYNPCSTDEGYVFPNMIGPVPGYQPNIVDEGHHFQNMIAHPPLGYDIPGTNDEEYNIIQNMIAPPSAPDMRDIPQFDHGYKINPNNMMLPPPGDNGGNPQGNNIVPYIPSSEYNDNPQGYNIPPGYPGFGPGFF